MKENEKIKELATNFANAQSETKPSRRGDLKTGFYWGYTSALSDNEKIIRKFYEPAFAEKNKELEELRAFAIWLTGCGYDFTQHKYFIKKRHLLSPFPLQSETKAPSK